MAIIILLIVINSEVCNIISRDLSVQLRISMIPFLSKELRKRLINFKEI